MHIADKEERDKNVASEVHVKSFTSREVHIDTCRGTCIHVQKDRSNKGTRRTYSSPRSMGTCWFLWQGLLDGLWLSVGFAV